MINKYSPPARGYRRTLPGQALVETAFVVVILSFLFMAAVDAGLAYKTYQTLMNSAAEASSYLAQNPLAGSPTPNRTQADANARTRFGEEQAGSRVGTSSADASIEILMAEISDISTTGGTFGVSDSFTGRTSGPCYERRNTDASGNPCFVVIKARTVYRPFMLTPAFGSSMTIRAISIKPVVGFK